MKKHSKSLFTVLLLAFVLCRCSNTIASVIYYTEGGWGATNVRKYDISTQNNQLLASSDTYTYIGVTIDTTSNKMYLAGRDKIQRANSWDGSELEQLVTGSFTSEGIALDLSSEKMYWSTTGGPWVLPPDGKIFRSNLDGSDIENLLDMTDRINGIALDLINSKMYWTQIEEINPHERSSWICRSNLDGSSIEYLTQGIEILNIALDISSEKMYWTDWIGRKVCRANLDGNDVEIIYNSSGNPHSITLDTINQKAYWTEWNSNAIYQSNLDGTNIEQMLSTGSNPAGIFFVPEPVIKVAVDIKPGSCPNPLRVNIKGNGVIPVAILGTEDFDVLDVDVATIALEGVSPVRSSFEDVSSPSEGEECECTTEGADGYLDLTLKFNRKDVLAALEESLGDLSEIEHRTDISLTLTAMLMGEELELEGADCIRILNRMKKAKK